MVGFVCPPSLLTLVLRRRALGHLEIEKGILNNNHKAERIM